MPYQYNIPLATDQLSKSQADINGNFQILGAIGGIPGINNSAGINTAPGAGFNYLFLSTAANPPVGSVFGANTALYSAPFAATGNQTNLFVNKVNNAGNQQYPITASILDTATPATNSSGWSYLPSGVIMKWGVVNVVGNAGGSLAVFDATVPFTAIFAGGVTPFTALNAYIPTLTTFTTVNMNIVNKGIVAGTFQAGTVYYWAIGR